MGVLRLRVTRLHGSPETESPEADEPTETKTEDEAMPRCRDDVQTRPPSLRRAIAQRKPPSTPPYASWGVACPSNYDDDAMMGGGRDPAASCPLSRSRAGIMVVRTVPGGLVG